MPDGTRPAPDAITTWAADRLHPADVASLASLPGTVRPGLPGHGTVLCCHATPRDDQEVALVDSRPERRAEVLARLDEDVTTVVCGHTHMPFVRLTHGRLVVNPDSVGMPHGRPGAHGGTADPGRRGDAAAHPVRLRTYDYIRLRTTTYDL